VQYEFVVVGAYNEFRPLLNDGVRNKCGPKDPVLLSKQDCRQKIEMPAGKIANGA
jgi:hypothetical protein